jgi:sec-independent protein translocase protein TatA
MTEILILVAVALLLFGGGKIADMGKGLGEGIKNFKKGLSGDDDEPSAPPAPKEDGGENKLTP